MFTLQVLSAILFAGLMATRAPAADADRACTALGTVKYADVTIAAADAIAPGQLYAGQAAVGPFQRVSPAQAFCRVQGTIEKEIGFELWLPLPDAWNGKFLAGGVGGDAGSFNLQDLPRGLARGYAAATTDTGHKASDRNWMLGDPMRLPNFEYRANHLLAVKSKEIIRNYYNAAIRHSYFVGCSGGGRQGLKEMQRFPEDFDGILVGAAGPKTPEMTTRRMWELLLRDKNPGVMSADDWKLVQQNAISSCDAADGVVDGVAEFPLNCKLNIEALACKAGGSTQCLSPKQIDFARQFYQPMRDEDGHAIDSGLIPGVLVDSGRSRLAPATFGQAVRKLEDWQGEGFSVKNDLAAIRKVMPDLAASDADLRPFFARGGKFIQYSGWMDPAVSANMVVEYQNDVRRIAGAGKTDESSRLYMVPGMYHCSGGPGADQFGGAGRDAPIVDGKHDLLTALEQWVEKGRAPGPMIASKVEGGKLTRTHLLCPFPQTAQFNGGNSDDAASYSCRASGQ